MNILWTPEEASFLVLHVVLSREAMDAIINIVGAVAGEVLIHLAFSLDLSPSSLLQMTATSDV
jgi:glycopeptide antibiotics resistance protein